MSLSNDSFLTLLKNNLDKYQDAALHTVENAVIAAGAGSGKTQVLATRFAWLIMTGQAKVDEILTLTFTNKAAAEMYHRIYKTLMNFANSENNTVLTQTQKQLARQALENFSYAHIQTLDSYCGSIVRQCANRYGIKPDFTTGSTDSERNIKDLAFTFILKNAENSAIQYFVKPGQLQNFAENTFAKMIINYTSLASEKGFFQNKLKNQLKEIVIAWNNLIIEKTEGSIYKYIDEIQMELNASDKKDDRSNIYINQIYKILESSELVIGLEPVNENDVINYSDKIKEQISSLEKLFVEILKTTQISKGFIQSIRKKVTALKNQIPFYESIQSFIENYNLILELNILLDDFLIQVNTSKRVSGNLTFTDVSELTLKMLLENEDIRNQEKNAYKKIMIDEFQDNNGKNRDLLYLLALKKGEFEDNGNCVITVKEGQSLHQIINRESEKLFFVGDEKQSIYKFRGADVSVFNELSQENKTVPMTYNYRSTPELVKAFNIIFKNGNGIFDNPDTTQKFDYEAYYEKEAEKNGIVLPELTKDNCPIHIVGLFKNELSDSTKEYLPEEEQIGFEIATRIKEIGDANGKWSKIAILDRSRNNRTSITKYLNMFGIPYELDAQKDIFTDAIINDFYNFLRLCVYPSDLNAFASYLCSPFAGLLENSVEIILSYKNSNDENIEDLIKKDLPSAEYTKYNQAKTFFEEEKSKVLQQKITTTLSELWNNRGFKYETMISPETELCAEHFDMLFELGRQADESGQSVSWFIDQLALLKNSYSKDDADLDASNVAYPLERKEAVKIMTIHKSKGLEFDYVFITGCTSYTSRNKKSTFFFDDFYGITLKPDDDNENYFFTIQKENSKKMELAEFRRLIYVAITRAKKEVYLMCSYSNPKNESQNIFRLIENKIVNLYPEPISDSNFPFYPDAGFDYIPIKPLEYKDVQKYITKKTPQAVLRSNILNNLPEKYNACNLINYECHPIPRQTPSGLETQDNKSIQYDVDSGIKYETPEDTLQEGNFTAADFGTLVHSYLEMQAKGIKPEDYEPEPKLFKKLDEKQRNENKEICKKMCKEFLESECGQQLETSKKAGLFYRAEWGFRMFLEGTIFTGSIDLIYENADGTYTIVDYKSDNQINSEKYFEQQMCYKKAAAKLLKIDEGKISNYLYFLKHQKLMELK